MVLVLAALIAIPASAASVPNLCPPGPQAGHCQDPQALAIDQSTGVIYVGENGNARVSEFDSEGNFLRAFGFGVLNGAHELQVCTASCQEGLFGAGAGRIQPEALAVDPTSHDVYVVDQNRMRVEKFTSAGEFLLTFGKEVNTTKVAAHAPEAEQDVCTKANLEAGDVCGEGTLGSSQLGGRGAGPGVINAGFFTQLPKALAGTALALDSTGDVWFGDAERLERFAPGGTFLEELKLPGRGWVTSLAVTSSGGFYAISPQIPEVQQFNAPSSGTYTLSFKGQTTPPLPFDATGPEVRSALQALSTLGTNVGVEESAPLVKQIRFVEALAGTDVSPLEASAGSVQTLIQGAPRSLTKLGPAGEVLQTLDQGGGEPLALALDPSSENLFVGDCQREPAGEACESPYSLLEYAPSGAQLSAFGAGAVIGAPEGNALGFNVSSQLLFSASARNQASALQAFPLPQPGPIIQENSADAQPIGKTSATLRASLNPEGQPTSCEFQYVDDEDFKSGGFANPATKTTPPSASVGEDFSEHPCSAEVTGLNPETIYHFRLIAHNADAPPQGVIGEAKTLTTLPPLRIEGTYATSITSSGADLHALVAPLGEAAEYRFEYLTRAGYEANGGSFLGPEAPELTPIPDGSIPALESVLTISQHVGGLDPAAEYVYRILLTNSLRPEGVAGPARDFKTQGAGGSLTLPDNRAWEMVSPVEKNGGGVSGINASPYHTLVQAAADGEAISFGSPIAFADPAGSPPGNQYISSRHGSAGWSTENIGIPINSETNIAALDPAYQAFAADLSYGLLSGGDGKLVSGVSTAPPNPPLPGTEAAPGFGNFYLRKAANSSYQAILTEAAAGSDASLPLLYEDATPDLSHIVLSEERGKKSLYVWSAGSFQPINILPGKVAPTNTSEGLGNGERQSTSGGIRDLRALSSDGTRAVWAARVASSQYFPLHNLYLRENIGQAQSTFSGTACLEPEAACTVQVDASEGGADQGGAGAFLAAAADGSAIFFADHQRLTADSTADQVKAEGPQLGDLYRFRPDAAPGERLTDLTVDPTDAGGAEVLGVLGASDGGSYVYFVANGVLTTTPNDRGEVASLGGCKAQGAVPGASCNLYLFHEGATTFLTKLDGRDIELESDIVSLGAGEGFRSGSWTGVGFRDARLSPDGKSLLFTSYGSLTGYDNSASNGIHCGTGESGELLPLACPEVFRYSAPTGAAPGGRLGCLSCNPTGGRPLGLSGVPVAAHTSNQEWEGIYPSRAISSDGSRAFFVSYDDLVPQDTNGKLDVYEWEAAGSGTCDEAAPTYSLASGGCIFLISSGTGTENSEFMDASADGSDVFFRAASSLVEGDPGSVDVYDARIGGGLPSPPPPAASCQGDACQSPPPVPNDPTPASSSYTGPENEAPAKGRKPRKKHHRSKHHHEKKTHKKRTHRASDGERGPGR